MTCFSQSGSIKGRITDKEGRYIENASVLLDENEGVITDSLGYIYFKDIDNGSHTLKVHHLNYIYQEKKVEIFNDSKTVNFTLVKNMNHLNEVVLTSLVETKDQKAKNSGYKVDIIKTSSYKNQSVNLTDIIKQSSGILIRETGGLGSNFKLSINGLSGNKIRFFIDGIPMENFGSSLTLNNFPVNLIKKVEIYKGVVPIELGADALGGAINISTVDLKKTYLDASYSFGSFNTHKASINGQYAHEKGFFTAFSYFNNYSDNNYRMDDVNVYDLDLGNYEQTISTNRFHDLYKSYMFNVKAGVTDKKYADKLYVGYIGAKNRKNYQHPDSNIETVYGDFHSRNETNIVSINYEKRIGNLNLKGFAVKGVINNATIDTSSVRYNWNEDTILRDENSLKGEIFDRKRFSIITDNIIRSSLSSSYRIDNYNAIKLNISQNYLKRKGEDKVDEFNYTFQNPNYLHKFYGGISYAYKSNNNKIRASVFAKRFMYKANIKIQPQKEGTLVSNEQNINKTGYGATFSYKATKNTLIKTSFENAYRLPNDYEILGDGVFVEYNENLEPEKSNNINLGVLNTSKLKDIRIKSEANIFLRFSENFIQLGASGGPYSQYENIDNVRSQGIEANIDLRVNKYFAFNVNATYQKIIDRTKLRNGLPNESYNTEVPNIPYFFTNSRITITPLDFQNKNELSLYLDSRYTKDFFLTSENSGDINTKRIIPSQFLNDVTLAYSMKKGMYNLSLSCLNIFDTKAYDNFNIQKPGRSFFVKFRFYLLNGK
ncbi:TonB-dependent receptor [Flavivirga aquimarina]|uniref:TonB-dependent receptor n=1 Tax=Flavivirga aquimarina TaxID=2027862 RepID=A0ABT8WC40_9FLAO|nr:TonB-dependent receptor [Flavivirga aquimarina]MDO5970712.1 TonB-dependent receptor [Flavivirga aquimarina]